MAPDPSAVVVVLLLAVLAITHCSGSPTSPHEIVKSPVYPNLPAGIRAFRDDPIHGPAVHGQAWYSNSNLEAELRIYGIQLKFLDGYKSPIHGYAKGNTTRATFDPKNDKVFHVSGARFQNLAGPKGATGGVQSGFISEGVLRPNPGVLEVTPTNPSFIPELSAVGFGPPGVILGLRGTVDNTGLTQLGYIIQARPLSFHESASGSAKGSLS